MSAARTTESGAQKLVSGISACSGSLGPGQELCKGGRQAAEHLILGPVVSDAADKIAIKLLHLA